MKERPINREEAVVPHDQAETRRAGVLLTGQGHLLIRDSELRLSRPRLFQRNALPAAIRQVSHVRSYCRTIANLYRRIRSLAAADAIDPVGHVVLIRSFSCECRPIMPIDLLRIVTNALYRSSGHHVGRSRYMFDGAVTSEQALSQTVMAVAKSGQPRDNCVCRIFERGDHRVR